MKTIFRASLMSACLVASAMGRTDAAGSIDGKIEPAVAAQCVTALQSIKSRRVDSFDPVILTIGTIHGGTRRNIMRFDIDEECLSVGVKVMSNLVIDFLNEHKDKAVK